MDRFPATSALASFSLLGLSWRCLARCLRDTMPMSPFGICPPTWSDSAHGCMEPGGVQPDCEHPSFLGAGFGRRPHNRTFTSLSCHSATPPLQARHFSPSVWRPTTFWSGIPRQAWRHLPMPSWRMGPSARDYTSDTSFGRPSRPAGRIHSQSRNSNHNRNPHPQSHPQPHPHPNPHLMSRNSCSWRRDPFRHVALALAAARGEAYRWV